MSTPSSSSQRNPLRAIRQLDYTVIFARDLKAMREFYTSTLGFEVSRKMGEGWIEFRIGASILTLTERGVLFNDPPPPAGALSLQLAFRVSRSELDSCAEFLRIAGVKLVHEPTDQPWGHRTVFFRDPDGNVLEIYAEI